MPERLPEPAAERRALVRAAILLGMVVTALVAAGSALPDPRIGQKQAEARQTLARIDQLGHALDRATEAYNGATLKLDRIRASLRVNEVEFRVARHDYHIGEARLSALLRQLYIDGPQDSTVDVLLGARSVEDAINALDGAQEVSQQDAAVVSEVERFKTAVIRARAVLSRERRAQERLVAARAAARAQIESGLAEQRRLLSSIRTEIVNLRRQEAIRQAQL